MQKLIMTILFKTIISVLNIYKQVNKQQNTKIKKLLNSKNLISLRSCIFIMFDKQYLFTIFTTVY